MAIKSYHIAAEFGCASMTQLNEMSGNANTIPNKNGNLFVTLNPGDVVEWVIGTLSLKCAGEIFWQLNAGPTGAASDQFLFGDERTNAMYPIPNGPNTVVGKTYSIRYPVPASWNPMGPVIAFNFQYINMTTVAQASGFEIQLNLLAS